METQNRFISWCSLITEWERNYWGHSREEMGFLSESELRSPIHQSLELPWKTAVQWSKYSINSWTGLLGVTSASEHIIFLLKYLLSDHLLMVYTNWSQIITSKGSLVEFHRQTSDYWCLEQLWREVLWLSSAKRVPASVVFWTHSPESYSSVNLGFKASLFCWWTKDIKRWTEVPHQGITTKNKTWSVQERKGDRELSQGRSARSWSQIKRQN